MIPAVLKICSHWKVRQAEPDAYRCFSLTLFVHARVPVPKKILETVEKGTENCFTKRLLEAMALIKCPLMRNLFIFILVVELPMFRFQVAQFFESLLKLNF